jgi:biopolymer transport protein ExbD
MSTMKRSDNSLIPLINIIFLLLIFYMIAGQISYSDGAMVEVPVSTSDKQLVPPPLQLTMTADGSVSINGVRPDPAALDEALRIALRDQAGNKISIKADRNVRAHQLQVLLDSLKDNGVDNITLFSQTSGDL